MSDSILQVNQIKDKGGNATGITIADTTANVTIGNLTGTAIAGTFNGTISSSATGNGIITLGETYRLNSATSQGTTNTLKDWVNTADFGSSSMSVNTTNGYFTPPSTGFYIISVNAMVYNDSNSTPRYIEVQHKFGGTEYLRATGSITDNATGHYQLISSNFIYDWTNTSNTLQIVVVSETNVVVNGSASKSFTTATFMKIQQ